MYHIQDSVYQERLGRAEALTGLGTRKMMNELKMGARSEREKQISYIKVYMWNPEKTGIVSTKQKDRHRSKNTHMDTRGERGDELGEWD